MCSYGTSITILIFSHILLKIVMKEPEAKEPEAFEKYPISTVFTFNLVSLLLYLVGLYLLSRINTIFAALFVLYLIAVEFSVYKEGCANCYYYGKRCRCGRGKIVALFLKKGDPKKFCEKQVTWKNLLPQVLISIIPILAGAYLLTQVFTLQILALTVLPLIIWFLGNPLLYGKLGCPHCKQGRICCPANEFFGKKA